MKPVIVLGYDARKCTRVLTYEYIHTRHLIHISNTLATH
jgi:hypothetical protein